MNPEPDRTLQRYARQMLYPRIGEQGQKRLRHSSVTIIGCGALGSVSANTLARAGVGSLRIVDRDFIELNNLQRQVLFDEQDIANGLPKAEAAARKLRRINSAIEIEPVVADANPDNIAAFCRDADVVLDGTDNFETRYLINDLCVQADLPWVYGAVIAAEGLVLPIVPNETPCLRCIWPDPPAAGTSPTCDTAGVLSPVVNIVASLQSLEVIKMLIGAYGELNRELFSIDVWTGRVRNLDMQASREGGACPCCGQRDFVFLAGERTSATVSLCGRNAVQIRPPRGADPLNLAAIAGRLPFDARPKRNEFMLRFEIEAHEFTLFPDGRAIIKGTDDEARARGLYARYIGG